MELSHLKAFLTVARKGNLSAAAKELGATQPNLGRQMTALSKEVGIDLFAKHSRGLSLTHRGREFFELCTRIVGKLEQETTLIREKNASVEGRLRIATGTGSVDVILQNFLPFSQKYPKLRISFSTPANIFTLDIFQSSLEVQMGAVDVAFWPFQLPDPNLIHHEFNWNLRILAAPRYLKAHGTPKNLEDLRHHRLIAYNGEQQATFNKLIISETMRPPYAQPFLEVNSGNAMRTALLSGLGIGAYYADKELMRKNLLTNVFPDIPSQKASYYYIYHKRLEGSPKIHAFQKFLEGIYDNYI